MNDYVELNGCEHCGKITTLVKRMEFCIPTIFSHDCIWINACLECRIIIQFVSQEYDILYDKLKSRIQDFSKIITDEMRLNYK